MHRFYHPDSLDVHEIELAGGEAQHLARVLRLSAGECVEVFDGCGRAVSAEIVSVGKKSARLIVLDSPTSTRQPAPSIRLLVAAPKSDRLRWMVEKVTELGVARLSLLQTRYSVVHPGDGKLGKLHAATLAACKQCGRNDLLSIDAPRPWEQVVEELSQLGEPFFMAVPGSPDFASSLKRLGPRSELTFAIGPEGGWESGEIEHALKHGGIAVGLGPLTLRIETAALAVAGAVRLAVDMPSD